MSEAKTKMNPEAKTLWLEALRSGEYKQGNGALNSGGKFCCLGVLCDVAIKAGVQVEVTETEYDGQIEYDGCVAGLGNSDLDHPVARWSGMWGLGYFSTGNLAALNDRATPFANIADTIEKEF